MKNDKDTELCIRQPYLLPGKVKWPVEPQNVKATQNVRATQNVINLPQTVITKNLKYAAKRKTPLSMGLTKRKIKSLVSPLKLHLALFLRFAARRAAKRKNNAKR